MLGTTNTGEGRDLSDGGGLHDGGGGLHDEGGGLHDEGGGLPYVTKEEEVYMMKEEKEVYMMEEEEEVYPT